MLDIGIGEIIVILILGLMILGPEKLPGAVRTVLVWWKRMKKMLEEAKTQVEQEVNYAEMTKNIENYQQSVQQLGDEIRSVADVDKINVKTGENYATQVNASLQTPSDSANNNAQTSSSLGKKSDSE